MEKEKEKKEGFKLNQCAELICPVRYDLQTDATLVPPISYTEDAALVSPISYADDEKKEMEVVEEGQMLQEAVRSEENAMTLDFSALVEEGTENLVKPVDYISDEVVRMADDFVDRTNVTPNIRRRLQLDIACAIAKNNAEGGAITRLYADEKKTKKCFNFRLDLEKIVENVLDTAQGERMRRCYSFTITLYSKTGVNRIFKTSVDSDKVQSFDWIRKATHSLATAPANKDEKAAFANLIADSIDRVDVPVEYVYPNAGWREIPGLGLRYVYAGGVIGENGRMAYTSDTYTLQTSEVCLGKKETFEQALAMTQICRNCMASTELLLFLHATTLQTVFERAGYPIKFVFAITGVTNSRKTSMAVAIAKLFNREDFRADAEFATATACGIEKTLSKYRDAVVLIDDFKPGVDLAEQRMMNKKLDTLARMYGDRVSKQRMLDFTANADTKFFPIGGGCVITMEAVTGVLSTISRMFITEIAQDTVDNDRLSFYQQQRWVLPTHIYDFLWWVTCNMKTVEGYICNNFERLRSEHKFEVERYAEMYATFMIAAHLLGEYARCRGFWNDQDLQIFCESVATIICAELKNMGERFRERDKATVVLAAFADAVERGKLEPIPLTIENAASQFECYGDENFVYIRAGIIKKIVEDYCKEMRENCFIMNIDELLGLLERKQAIYVIRKNDDNQTQISGKKDMRRTQRSMKLPVGASKNPKRYVRVYRTALIEP